MVVAPQTAIANTLPDVLPVKRNNDTTFSQQSMSLHRFTLKAVYSATLGKGVAACVYQCSVLCRISLP